MIDSKTAESLAAAIRACDVSPLGTADASLYTVNVVDALNGIAAAIRTLAYAVEHSGQLPSHIREVEGL